MKTLWLFWRKRLCLALCVFNVAVAFIAPEGTKGVFLINAGLFALSLILFKMGEKYNG